MEPFWTSLCQFGGSVSTRFPDETREIRPRVFETPPLDVQKHQKLFRRLAIEYQFVPEFRSALRPSSILRKDDMRNVDRQGMSAEEGAKTVEHRHREIVQRITRTFGRRKAAKRRGVSSR